MAETKGGQGGGITKQEAVRQALAELGPDAKPLAIQAFVKDRLGMEVKTDLISFYKKEAKGKAKAKGKPTARTPPAQASAAPKAEKEATPGPTARPAPAPAAGGKSAGIPLDDILYIKELVGRFGPGPLHTLVDAFAK